MRKKKTVSLALISIMAAITCILGPLSIVIPISPVPISLTNLAIYLTVIILGCKKGTISYLIYLLIGFVGLPVFSNFSSGPAKLLGPTGGYLIGFIFMAFISGLFVDRFRGKTHMYIVGMVLGTVVTYVIGTGWLAYQIHSSFGAALSLGVFPFIPGDMIKIVIATILGTTIKKQLIKSGLLTELV